MFEALLTLMLSDKLGDMGLANVTTPNPEMDRMRQQVRAGIMGGLGPKTDGALAELPPVTVTTARGGNAE